MRRELLTITTLRKHIQNSFPLSRIFINVRHL